MTLPITLPENFKIIAATPGPVTTNGGVTFDYISLKHAHKAWILAQFRQAASHATTLQPRGATSVAGAGADDTAFTFPWWKNADVGTSDSWVRQTAASIATLTAGTTHQGVIIQIDPAEMAAEGWDVLGGVVSDSSQATNFVSAWYIVAPRYQQSNPPSMIVD